MDDNFIAPNATVAGEVFLNSNSTVWYNAVVRGDLNKVEIGDSVSVGEGTVINTVASLPTGLEASTYIGHNVSIGANSVLTSCYISDDVVIGARSIVMEGA